MLVILPLRATHSDAQHTVPIEMCEAVRKGVLLAETLEKVKPAPDTTGAHTIAISVPPTTLSRL